MHQRAEDHDDDARRSEPLVRLDALDVEGEGRSFSFHDCRYEIVAHRLDEVMAALGGADQAVREGMHVAGFVAYEAAAALEPRFATRPPVPGLPLVWFGVFASRRERAASELPPEAQYTLTELRPSLQEHQYHAGVARILEWIAAGDTYQVNYTFRLRGSFRGSDHGLYRDLCAAQQAAFCAHVRIPRYSILSASPELFFHRSGDRLEMRPMKGTRPRGRWAGEDHARAEELLASAKDRAENLMIVDLLRNDAGRIAHFGSVQVPELFQVERYPTVHQLTSTVTARTLPDIGLREVMRALFPSGSVTGAPKIRTSQIIAALEDAPRGVYTGAIGFVSPDQTVFSVAIRTLVLDRETGAVELGVGSGITADSDARAEYRECLDKAAFVFHRPPEFRLLESLLFRRGEGFLLLDEHLERMADSAHYFGFRFRPDAMRALLLQAAGSLAEEAYKVRLLVDRDGRAEVQSEPLQPTPLPVRVGLAPLPVDESDPLLFHKTTHRQTYRERAALRPDCDDVILVNRRGELTESTTSNLVVRLGGELLTPPLEAGLLPGVFRRHLLQRGEIRARTLHPEDLERAEGIYLVNSVRQWREAVRVG